MQTSALLIYVFNKSSTSVPNTHWRPSKAPRSTGSRGAGKPW